MKFIIGFILSIFLIFISKADEKISDPFALNSQETAASLKQCAKGHKTLKDVPIIYGHVGMIMAGSPEVAKKVKAGEVILGGCILGGDDHQVVCSTCKMVYDKTDEFWAENFPNTPFSPDGTLKLGCSLEVMREVMPKDMSGFILSFNPDKKAAIQCSRSFRGKDIVAGVVSLLDKSHVADALKNTELWLKNNDITAQKTVKGEANMTDQTWEWLAEGRSYQINIFATDMSNPNIVFSRKNSKFLTGQGKE